MMEPRDWLAVFIIAVTIVLLGAAFGLTSATLVGSFSAGFALNRMSRRNK